MNYVSQRYATFSVEHFIFFLILSTSDQLKRDGGASAKGILIGIGSGC